MSYSTDDRLTLLPLPQRWEVRDDGATGVVHLRAVLLPRGNPLLPLITGTAGVADAPAFADASLRLQAMLIPSTTKLPDPIDVAGQVGLPELSPNGRRGWFETLADRFAIDPAIEDATRNPRRAGRQIKKLLVPSYTSAFAFSGPRTPFAVMDASYACALRRACALTGPQGDPAPTATSWGRIIAQALRQPLLAEALGILQVTEVELPAPDFYADGGWLYLALAGGSDYTDHAAAEPAVVASYAARIPPLETARPLFAPLFFPVTAVPPPGDYDELYGEVARYDDGFAKVVHCAQQHTADPAGLEDAGLGVRTDADGEAGRQGPPPPPVRESGIHLGWDDEQLVIWMNRQISDPTVERRNAPMGVLGYRVDVRRTGTTAWHSLVHVRGDLAIGDRALGHFDGELPVEVVPLQLDNAEDGDYWMPAYFTQWLGHSLIADDELGLRVSGVEPGEAAAPNSPHLEPVDDVAVPLRYGEEYDFRVRLVDISGGGPGPDAAAINPAPAPVVTCRFRRFLPPDRMTFEGLTAAPDPGAPPQELRVLRPRLGYPAATYTGVTDAVGQLLTDIERIRNADAGDVPGIPDPDVVRIELTVQVGALELDPGNDADPSGSTDDERIPVRTVYRVERAFPASPDAALSLPLEWVNVNDVSTLVAPADGPLPLPRARDVVLTVRAVGRDDPELAYFGTAEARLGERAVLGLRADPDDESALFVPQIDTERLRGVLLAPDEASTASLRAKLHASGRGVQAEHDGLRRLAEALDLEVDTTAGPALTGRGGQRTVFGCAGTLSHTLAPDASAVIFASRGELSDRWLAVLTVNLARDWTWDALDNPAFEVERVGDGVVGTVQLPRVAGPAVTRRRGVQVDRSVTRVVFLDAVDPQPVAPHHPEELRLHYRLRPRFRRPAATEPDTIELSIDLPIAAPPTQTPKLAAAGLALSPFERAADYSSTEPRQRMLWVEFEGPPENPADAYFARVLSYAPDPMLTRDSDVEVPPEPPLPIDPEPIRVIRPGQGPDRAGLAAMQPLLPTESPQHFLMPLPPGLSADARELFGFFVYELRVGHAEGWSTARARFGPALRVTGVQHPNPTLPCQGYRAPDGVASSAEYATPVFGGRSLLPSPPATLMWLLLYAQAMQADGQDRRNILIGRKPGWMRRTEGPLDRPDLAAFASWSDDEINRTLAEYGLPADAPLSVLAVELLPEQDPPRDPLGTDLGHVRILRTSPLMPIPPSCVEPVCSSSP